MKAPICTVDSLAKLGLHLLCPHPIAELLLWQYQRERMERAIVNWRGQKVPHENRKMSASRSAHVIGPEMLNSGVLQAAFG
jgi:hypothetical protein